MIAAIRQPTLLSSWIGQAALSLLAGLVLGLVVIVLSGQNFPTKFVAMVAGGLAGLVVLLISKDVRRLLLIAIYIDTSTAFDFHITCTNSYYVSSCGFNISVTALALAGLYALWVIELRRKHSHDVPPARPFLTSVGTMLVAFIGAGVLSLIQTKVFSLSLYQIWIYLVIFLAFFYIINHVKNENDVRFYIYSLAIGLSIQVAIMELQALGLVGNAQGNVIVGSRIVGTLHSPNIAGGYLAQVLLLIFASLFIDFPRWHKLGLALLLAMALQSLIGTESRGAWLGGVMGGSLIVFIGIWRGWIKLQTLIPLIMIVTVFGLLFFEPISKRLTADDNGAADARGPLAEIATNMVRANPVTGVGINNFGVALKSYIEPGQYGAWLSLVHNYWLLVWSETGTIGFAMYILFWVATFWKGFRLIRSDHPVYRVIAAGLMGSLVAVGVHMLGEIYSGRNSIQLIWLNAAVITAMAQLLKQQKKSQETLPLVQPAFSRVTLPEPRL